MTLFWAIIIVVLGQAVLGEWALSCYENYKKKWVNWPHWARLVFWPFGIITIYKLENLPVNHYQALDDIPEDEQ